MGQSCDVSKSKIYCFSNIILFEENIFIKMASVFQALLWFPKCLWKYKFKNSQKIGNLIKMESKEEFPLALKQIELD